MLEDPPVLQSAQIVLESEIKVGGKTQWSRHNVLLIWNILKEKKTSEA